MRNPAPDKDRLQPSELTEADGAPPADVADEVAAATAAADAPEPDLPFDLSEATHGRYLYLGEIRSGGMGRVILAEDRELGRRAAVKVILSRHLGNPLATARFMHEARITASLVHPGVIPVYDVGTSDTGRHYFIMQCVEGVTLRQMMDTVYAQVPPDPADISHLLNVFQRACQSVGYVHYRNVIHRDLKPANIMVGSFGEVLIMDWGLAKRLDEDEAPGDETAPPPRHNGDQTTVGRINGTPSYMSPEQAGGQVNTLTPSSDVFSLGVILCEILTGRKPFVAGSLPGLLEAIQAGRRASVAELARRAGARRPPRVLAAICDRALQLDPARRYPTARELAKDLEAYVEHRAVSAYREPWYARGRRWLRRHRATTAGLLGVLATALIVLAALLVDHLALGQLTLELERRMAAGRVRYDDVVRRLEWTERLLAREPDPAAPQSRELASALYDMQADRILAAEELCSAMSNILAAQRRRADPRVAAEFRRLWVEETVRAAENGFVEFARASYLRMQQERGHLPWWDWEQEEFARLEYLHELLRRHPIPGQPELEAPANAPAPGHR